VSYKNKQKEKLTRAKRHRRTREAVIDKLGGACVICGFSDYRALQIDHVNGGGTADRKVYGHRYGFLRRVLDDTNNTYQLLCANCNWIKRWENHEERT